MEVTKRDVDNLADIAWLIKGYLMDNLDETDLTEEHVESIRKVRQYLKDKVITPRVNDAVEVNNDG